MSSSTVPRIPEKGCPPETLKSSAHVRVQERERAFELLEVAVAATPWALTENFVGAMREGRGRLALTGPGDPTGRGAGFSFFRDDPKVACSPAARRLSSLRDFFRDYSSRPLGDSGTAWIFRPAGSPVASVLGLQIMLDMAPIQGGDHFVVTLLSVLSQLSTEAIGLEAHWDGLRVGILEGRA